MRVISLGAGVQSSAMLLMGVRGEFGDRPDAAIFADTGWEPAGVYRQLDWLTQEAGIPIYRVSAGDLRRDALNPRSRFVSMPLHVRTESGKPGLMRRQCTSEYKVEPILKKLRELGATAARPIEQWIGISLDEAHRMRDPRRRYCRHRYPLVDARLTRHDCAAWLERHGYPIPPKSACIGCPFHGDNLWREMRDLRPEEWADAVAFDAAIRTGRVRIGKAALRGQAFLHSRLVPLDQVDLSTPADHGQLEMFGNDCEGMCGV